MIWYDRCRVHNCLNKNHVLTTCTVCKCKKYMHIIYCLIHRHLCLPFLLHQLLRHPSHPRDCLYSPNMLCQAMLGASLQPNPTMCVFRSACGACVFCRVNCHMHLCMYIDIYIYIYCVYKYTVCICMLYILWAYPIASRSR